MKFSRDPQDPTLTATEPQPSGFDQRGPNAGEHTVDRDREADQNRANERSLTGSEYVNLAGDAQASGTNSRVTSPKPAVSSWRDQLVVGTLQRLFRHRFLCIALIFVATAGGGAATFFMKPFYIARASIFPPVSDNPLGSFGLPGMIGLVGNFNLGDDGSSLFPLYERFLFSRTLISDLLEISLAEAGFNGTLMDHLQIEKSDPVVRRAIATAVVRRRLSFEADKKTVVVTIGYRDADPRIAAAVVNKACELLDRLDVNTSTQRAAERRRFIEARLHEAGAELTQAEKRLEKFREENLRIGNAPELLMQQARLQREIEIQTQIYVTLRKEYELTRIEEQRRVPVVNVLDLATAPLVPAGPSLTRNAGLAGIVGTVLVVMFFALQSLGVRRYLVQFTSAHAKP